MSQFFSSVRMRERARNFDAGTSYLVKGSVLVVRAIWRTVKEHTLSASRYMDRGEGRGTPSLELGELNGPALRLRFTPDLSGARSISSV